jgi:polyisoprenoid-binding protein YceI
MTTWQIDPAHSHVEFAVRHLMISTVRGRFGALAGSMTLDDHNPSALKLSVAIDAASIDTREERRDAHLRSADFLDTGRFPVIAFDGTGVSGNLDGSFQLRGNLTIHGVTRPVTLEVTSEGRGNDPWGNERAGYSAKTRIRRSEFGLTWNQLLEAGGVAVGDDISITIDVELVRQVEAAAVVGVA